MTQAVLINEWDSDSFHRKVLEFESKGYEARQESYHIRPEVDPETGEIVHLYSIEMDLVDPGETRP